MYALVVKYVNNNHTNNNKNVIICEKLVVLPNLSIECNKNAPMFNDNGVNSPPIFDKNHSLFLGSESGVEFVILKILLGVKILWIY